MSVNYHAFQNRGYLFSNHETLEEQWHSAFAGYDPARISRILHLETDAEYLYLSYYQKTYRLQLGDGHLERKTESGWTDKLYFNETMSIYHLLQYTKDHPRTAGVWVPNTALEGAGTHNRNLPDPLLTPFAARFSGKTDMLEKACLQLGGIRLDKGDIAFQFISFPQIPLQLIFWDADEDFPAQVQVLFDQYVTDYLHFETTGCVISDLLEMLEDTVHFFPAQ
ncbi:MAG: DUF3786 domain-containing protein [Blautia sp.]|nr:DUF3786 domain-containing protein [Blautia sp.]MDY4000774.1 DUF3786 domain-containing protein [Blautia sp.]